MISLLLQAYQDFQLKTICKKINITTKPINLQINKVIFLLLLVTFLLACRNEKHLTLADFIEIESINGVEMQDSISKYFLSSTQTEEFKSKLGQLLPADTSQIDTLKFKKGNIAIYFNDEPTSVQLSKAGDFIKINSSWITKNKDTLSSQVFKTEGIFEAFPAEERMTIYAISGLGADSRVYKKLDLAAEVKALDWIAPQINEPINEYAMRLAEEINTDQPYAVMGVSFGGLVAVEIGKALHPDYTLLLSTVETKDELRNFFKLVNKYELDKDLPVEMFDPPKPLIQLLFGANKENRALLNEILEDSDPYFAKWAIGEMMSWNNETRIHPVLKISGTKDRVIPPPKVENIHLIEGAGHFMVVDRHKKVSRIINKFILQQQNEIPAIL